MEMKNYNLKNNNTLGFEVVASSFIMPEKIEDFTRLLKETKKHFIIGNGSNIILPNEVFDGTVICTKNLKGIKIDGDTAIVECGVMWSYLNKVLLENGFVNLAMLSGIPGTVGAGVKTNVGCNKTEMFDHLLYIRVYNNNEIVTIKKEDINYGYRYSDVVGTVLEVAFKLSEGNVDETKTIMREFSDKRLLTQPLSMKNAGSTFKNPEGYSAGYLIENAGLKGYSIGDSTVSNLHANFLVNKNASNSNDHIDLINHVKSEVLKKYNIELVLENEVIKWDEL